MLQPLASRARATYSRTGSKLLRLIGLLGDVRADLQTGGCSWAARPVQLQSKMDMRV